jgi:hypothetical protein
MIPELNTPHSAVLYTLGAKDLQFRVLNRYSAHLTRIGEAEIIELLVQDCGTDEAQHGCSGFNCDCPFCKHPLACLFKFSDWCNSTLMALKIR